MDTPIVNWREAPFVRLFLPLGLGIVSAVWAPDNEYTIAVVAFATIVSIIGLARIGLMRVPYQKRWVFGLILSLCFFGLGRVLVFVEDERHGRDHFSTYLTDSHEFVASVRQIQLRGERIRLHLRVVAAGASGAGLEATRGRLLAYLPRDVEGSNIRTGDLLRFKASIGSVPEPKNPKAFDYRRYLHFKNIHYQCFLRPGEWRIVLPATGWSLSREAVDTRNHFVGILRKHLPSPSEFGVASALILGYRDETPETLREAYAATGATHVLAVSGLHVGIVQLVITYILQFWGGKRREHRLAKMCITLVGVWGFALITGAPSSALRAATMFSFLTVGRAMKRTVNTYNSILASAFFLLCINPYLLFDVGFQLSYLAVLGIVFFHPRIYKLWYVENRLGDKLWQLAALSLAATLTTFPLSLLYFHQFPVYFWLSGLVAVPLAGVILSLGILLFVTHAIPFAGIAAGKLLYGAVWFMNAAVFLIEQLPGSRISGIWISAQVALLLYGVIGAVAFAIVTRKFRWILAALVMGVLVAGMNAFESWTAFQRRELIVYHTRRQTVIDCFDGTQLYTLARNPVTDAEQRFALQNYRWYCRSTQQYAALMDESPPPQARWFYRKGLLRFHNLRVAIIDSSQPAKQTAEKWEADILLVCSNPEASLQELIAGWNTSSATILFDASNSRRRVDRWLAECERLGASCWDIDRNGAWIVKIKPKY